MIRDFMCTRYLFALAGLLLNIFIMQLFTATGVYAGLVPLSSRVIEDSPAAFDRRIISYDMGIDSSGDVHIVYSQPYSDTYAYIYYVRRISGVWQAKQHLSSNGIRGSISTHLVIGGDDRVHVCYNKNNGSSKSLIYRVINGGVVGDENDVDPGGWHARMQLDGSGYPVFVRAVRTFPEDLSKIIFLTTTNGTNWLKSYLPLTLTQVTTKEPEFRIADFLYANGKYHITYGGSELTRNVWNSKYETEREDRVFHYFHYAVSADGVNWDELTIDTSGWLNEWEFWTELVNDGNKILVGMYKYNEATGCYNCGTSAILVTINGLSWTSKIITNQQYVDTLEGAGIGLAVAGSGDYFGAWDLSPDYPQILPGSIAGNTAMRRNGPKNDWSPVTALDPFSLEGKARLRVHNGKLFFLALGDYTDEKLYFREFTIPYLNTVLEPPGGFPPPPNPNAQKGLPAIMHMLLRE